MPDAKVIGERLIKLRGEKSRKEIATAVGVTYTAMTNYEIGLRVPRDEIKVGLARYYNTTIEEIFFS